MRLLSRQLVVISKEKMALQLQHAEEMQSLQNAMQKRADEFAQVEQRWRGSENDLRSSLHNAEAAVAQAKEDLEGHAASADQLKKMVAAMSVMKASNHRLKQNSKAQREDIDKLKEKLLHAESRVKSSTTALQTQSVNTLMIRRQHKLQ